MTTAASSKKHADGTPYHYYICTNKIHNRGTCTCKTAIAEEILDSVIVSALAYIGGKDVTASEIKSSVDSYKLEITRELESLKPKQYNLEVEVKKAMERFATIADDTLANVAASIAAETTAHNRNFLIFFINIFQFIRFTAPPVPDYFNFQRIGSITG